jgi:phage gp36-like protein
MSYCTPADLLEKCEALELAQAAVTSGGIACNEDCLAALIEEESTAGFTAPEIALAQQALDSITAECDRATRRMDMRLRVRYTLPFLTPVPPELLPLAIDIARYGLHDQAATDEIRNRYKEAMAELDRIANGTSSITLPPGTVTDTGGSPAYSEGWPREFTRSTLARF